MIEWLTIPDFLDALTRDHILSALRQANDAPAAVYGVATGVDERVRKARMLSLEDDLCERVKVLLADAQPRIADYFDVTLTSCEEPQFLRYLPGDFFVAHQDGNTPLIRDDSRHRLISVVIVLSPSSDEPSDDAHGGGAFVFHGQYPDWRERHVVPQAPGALIAFRSETTHEVTPVTHGRRYSIVSWYR